MLNLIGEIPEAMRNRSTMTGIHLHDYGKAPRPGRKLGHITWYRRRLPAERATRYSQSVTSTKV